MKKYLIEGNEEKKKFFKKTWHRVASVTAKNKAAALEIFWRATYGGSHDDVDFHTQEPNSFADYRVSVIR